MTSSNQCPAFASKQPCKPVDHVQTSVLKLALKRLARHKRATWCLRLFPFASSSTCCIRCQHSVGRYISTPSTYAHSRWLHAAQPVPNNSCDCQALELYQAIKEMLSYHTTSAFLAGVVTATAGALLAIRHLGFRRLGRPAVHVKKPHPDWQPGQQQPPPFDPDDMHVIDPDTIAESVLYPLVISAVVPRPIGFASTMAADGSVNLAPFSYFNVMSHNPVVVAFGVSRSSIRSGGKKDSLQNIEETREFTINIMSEWFVEAANHTCGSFDRGVNEFEQSGLTPIPSQKVKPPRVRESAVQMECKLKTVIDLQDKNGKDTAAVVLGEVVLFHIADGVAGRSPTGKLVVDAVKLRPVCRLGGVTYGSVTELYDIPRPDGQGKYAK